MKELPILFSTPMVQAIIEDRKEMTRRTAGLDHINIIPESWICLDLNENGFMKFFNEKANLKTSAKPRYQVGDILWVKETFSFAPLTKETKPFYPELSDYIYKAGSNFISVKWKSSLFMPKKASRLWLEITSIKCERLKDITNKDAFAEGIEWKIKYPEESPETKYYRDYMFNDRFWAGEYFNAKNSFFTLWKKINGNESLKSNPWVFVYSFKKINK